MKTKRIVLVIFFAGLQGSCGGSSSVSSEKTAMSQNLSEKTSPPKATRGQKDLLNPKSVCSQETHENFAKAIAHKNIELVRCLIEKGADVNQRYKGFSPLCLAIVRAEPKMVTLLIKEGAVVDEVCLKGDDDDKHIHLSATGGPLEILQVLIDGGADVNQRGEGTYTPLMLATLEGRLDKVKLLLSRGAICWLTSSSYTALDFANTSGGGPGGQKKQIAVYLQSRLDCKKKNPSNF